MATESSAVVRFINLVQKDHQPIYSEGIRETSVDLRPQSSKGTKIAVGVTLAAGLAIGGGFAVGRGYFDSSSSSSSSLRSTPPATPAPSAAPGTPLPAPSAAPPPAQAPLPVATPLVTVPPDALAETGFDIRVSPPGRVSVDAQLLGTAPLRIRNLQPGAHVIDVEAPAGYFSRRIEVDLVAGDPQQVKIDLDAIEDDAVAGVDEEKPAAEKPRARKESQKQTAREKKLAARAEKAAAVAEAKRVARERAELKREAARDEKERRAREAKEAKESKVAAKQTAADDDLEAAMSSVTGGERGAKKAAPKVSALAPEAPAVSGAPGTLMLGSKPLCDIYIDGKNTGLKTPQRSMELAAGTYKIKLVNAELGIDKTFKVKIAAGKTTRAIQDLTK